MRRFYRSSKGDPAVSTPWSAVSPRTTRSSSSAGWHPRAYSCSSTGASDIASTGGPSAPDGDRPHNSPRCSGPSSSSIALTRTTSARRFHSVRRCVVPPTGSADVIGTGRRTACASPTTKRAIVPAGPLPRPLRRLTPWGPDDSKEDPEVPRPHAFPCIGRSRAASVAGCQPMRWHTWRGSQSAGSRVSAARRACAPGPRPEHAAWCG
jgi:hypothetical protein